MKYAREIMELMSAYPKRDFRMKDLVKSIVGHAPSSAQKHRVRIQIANVIRELEAMGYVFRRPPSAKRGGFALYRWRG
ncbi:Putative phage protein [Mycoavidus cysteinexigens]|uniref:Phage protein n=1 Tax=Mycoavidus cysteinexigens TaxID=1553431 RepID=A0A2Z6EWX1_9BURK|nr:hypothetical protein [Mycoavidus cysteinexigens]BBE09595.1 Putative phage protein [Mycoavidus cysteinexigens]GAM51643.1 hypothetical protein EBME_0106 [bacterium endosymbiont of Mortierella elongata FMR23-6]GLR02335.1 hypothetical protein GCM10007934_21520 [Mycoavidus cysteinexigens]